MVRYITICKSVLANSSQLNKLRWHAPVSDVVARCTCSSLTHHCLDSTSKRLHIDREQLGASIRPYPKLRCHRKEISHGHVLRSQVPHHNT